MRTSTTTGQATLVQAGFTSAATALVLAAVTVLGPAAPTAAPSTEQGVEGAAESLWSQAWSERFPGCVAMVLWPVDERPVALVTRSASGAVSRVSADSPRRLAPDERAIGACR